MTKKVNVMAIQMSSILGDKPANFKKAETLIKQNIKTDTDILFLPEVWTVGWACEYFLDSAEEIKSSSTIEFLSKIAKKYNTNIIGGSFITKKDNKYFNTCPVINREGNLIGTYDKCHLYNYYGDIEGEILTAGTSPVMIKIEDVKIGLSICYDIRFPELYRSYATKGVDIMVNLAAWGIKKEIPWTSMTHSRAVENQCYFIALTQSGKLKNNEYNLGKSFIIDYKGDNLAEINSGEGAIDAILDIEAEYDFRKKCTVFKDIHKKYEVKEI